MKIIWTPTQRCPLYAGRSCAYCGYLESTGAVFDYMDGLYRYPLGPEWLSWEWIERFKTLPPGVLIAMTGGEPLAYPRLVEVLSACPSIVWAITTNLVYDPGPFLPYMAGWTCSYHYLAPENVRRRFFRHLRLLPTDRASVTIEAYPPAWERFLTALEEVRATGRPCQVHLHYAPGYVFPRDRLEELRGLRVRIVPDLSTWHGQGVPRHCQAGRDYAAWGPDGQVYRCYTWQHLNLPGLESGPFCNTPCLFPCDWEVPRAVLQEVRP